MKRFVFSVFAAVYALSFAACEPHPVSELPEHYQHKPGNSHHVAHDDHASTDKHTAKDAHAKAAAADPHAKPAEGEKKAH